MKIYKNKIFFYPLFCIKFSQISQSMNFSKIAILKFNSKSDISKHEYFDPIMNSPSLRLSTPMYPCEHVMNQFS